MHYIPVRMQDAPDNWVTLTRTIGAQCFCLHSRMTARAVTRQYNSILASIGLEVTEFSLLAALTVSEDASITTLADRLAFERTTLVRNLKSMAERGLIRRAGSRGRAVRYQLTAQGQHALEKAVPLWMQAQKSVLSKLEAREAKGILPSLHALRKAARTRD